MNIAKKIFFLISCLGLIAVSGCAFDVTHIKQTSANLLSAELPERSWKLVKNVTITLDTGYKRTLKADTTWNHVGNIEQGKVYNTKDQILTVEGSNIFEAYIVLSEGNLIGFYLPVEKTYSPLSSPVKLELETFDEN